MEYLDSRKKPLREGMYRDRTDKSYILYIFQEDGKWRYKSPDYSMGLTFPVSMSKELEPIDEPMKELERFRNVISFLEEILEKKG